MLSLLFGERTPSGFALEGVVEFQADLTIEEMHERSADVTESPVEGGGVVSDHIVLNPERLRLEGFVTDATPAPLTFDRGKTQAAFDRIDEAFSSGEPMTVVTGRKVYENMVLVRADLPREKPSSMEFTLEFVRVVVVAAEMGELAAADIDADVVDQVAPEVDAGRQPTGAAGGAASDQGSFLYDLFF